MLKKIFRIRKKEVKKVDGRVRKDYDWIRGVIATCTTEEHLEAVENLVSIFCHRWTSRGYDKTEVWSLVHELIRLKLEKYREFLKEDRPC